MNSTNRALNRILILVVGAVALAVGAGLVLWSLVPGIQEAWRSLAPDGSLASAQVLQRTEIARTGVSAVTVGLVALLVVIIALLAIFIFRQGKGHTSVVVRERSDGGRTTDAGDAVAGSTVITSSVAESLLSDAVRTRNEFISTRVSSYSVRGVPTLKVSVTCRRGVSPRDAASIVETAVLALDRTLGRSLPTVVNISGGFRSTVSKASRVV